MKNIFRDHYTNCESQISKKFYYGTEIVNENMPLSYVSHIREVGNCLIFGTTGAGKTVFLEKNIESLCGATKPEHLAIFLLNTKRDEYLYIKKQYKDFICNIDKKVIGNHQNDHMDSDVKIIESAILDAVNYQMILTNEGFDNIDEYNKHLEVESKGITGFQFTWFTDGVGWNTAKHNLEETFDVLDNLYNLNDLENGIIKKLVNPKDFIEDSLK